MDNSFSSNDSAQDLIGGIKLFSLMLYLVQGVRRKTVLRYLFPYCIHLPKFVQALPCYPEDRS